MILTIHQPEFLPWLGFFHKMETADRYVVLDSVQFEKNYFQNRNKIRIGSNGKWAWITLPVLHRDRSTQLIKDVELDQSVIGRQLKKNWKTIEQNYGKAPYFKMFQDRFREILLNRQYERLLDVNLKIISAMRTILSIDTPVTLASELNIDLSGSRLLSEICKRLGATTYLSGPHGRNYLDESHFQRHGIKIEYHEFNHPEYSQINGGYIPYMSTLDLIFNHGPQSRKILLHKS